MRNKAMRTHLCQPESRQALIHQLVTKIRAGMGERDAKDFALVCELVRTVTLELPKKNLGSLSEL